MTAQDNEKTRPHPTELPPALAAAPRLEPPTPSEPAVAPIASPMFKILHSEFANFHEGYVRHYIALADAKAGVIFTLAAGIIGYLISSDDIRANILGPFCSAKFIISVFALLFLASVALLSFLVIAPHLAAPSHERLVFFGAVAKRPTANQYIHDIASSNEQEIAEARLRHCYDTAKVCARKYGLLKAAIWLIPPGLLLALVTVLLA